MTSPELWKKGLEIEKQEKERKNMKLINKIDSKIYQKIKAEGGDYRRRFHERLAMDNNLENTTLYKELHSIPVTKDNYYVICVLNQKECTKLGYTQSPFDYWMNLLTNSKNTIDSFTEIKIIEKDLTLREAKRWHKYLNQDRAAVNRKIKILLALKKLELNELKKHLVICFLNKRAFNKTS